MHTEIPAFALPWSRKLDVVLHGICDHPDGGIDLSVAYGDVTPRTYQASVDASEPGLWVVSFEEPLFFALSEYAVRRYANATLYQMELGAIAEAYVRGDPVPSLPIRLGTSAFAEQPTISTLLRRHAKRLLYRWRILEPDVWVHPDYRPGPRPDPRETS